MTGSQRPRPLGGGDPTDGEHGPVRPQPAIALPAAALTVTLDTARPGVSVLSVVGEVDLLTAPMLRDAVAQALEASPAHLVVDLSAVSFMGALGLTVLAEAQRGAEEQRVALDAVVRTRAVRRVLELSGLHAMLRCHDSVEAAVAAPPDLTP